MSWAAPRAADAPTCPVPPLRHPIGAPACLAPLWGPPAARPGMAARRRGAAAPGMRGVGSWAMGVGAPPAAAAARLRLCCFARRCSWRGAFLPGGMVGGCELPACVDSVKRAAARRRRRRRTAPHKRGVPAFRGHSTAAAHSHAVASHRHEGPLRHLARRDRGAPPAPGPRARPASRERTPGACPCRPRARGGPRDGAWRRRPDRRAARGAAAGAAPQRARARRGAAHGAARRHHDRLRGHRHHGAGHGAPPAPGAGAGRGHGRPPARRRRLWRSTRPARAVA
jgi:hypothetical protein